jgi:penicillin-binding protein 2
MEFLRRQRRWRTEKPRTAAAGRTPDRRTSGLYVVIIIAISVLLLQLARLQIFAGSEYRLQADGNRLRVVQSAPARGAILDRSGRPLARNVPVYTAVVIPADLPVRREAEVFRSLEALVGVPAHEIARRVTRVRGSVDPFQPVRIAGELPQETALILAERRQSLPGVEVQVDTTRVYEYGDVLAQVLGYTGRMSDDEVAEYRRRGYLTSERVGKTGVELTYESRLRGTPGRRQIEVDATGKEVRVLSQEAPRPGASLVLSIDAELQRGVTQILSSAVAGLASPKAVAMIMDVRTGELLAMVSLPTYNNNLFSYSVDDDAYDALLTNPAKPLLNHGVAEKFPPGSTFKIVTGLAALQEGVATTRTTVVSRGTLLVPRDFDNRSFDSFPDWHPNLGALDFYRGVAMSSDIYFYCLSGGHCPQVENPLGSVRLARYARMFGFGELTGIDLPNETDGLVGDAEWLKQTTQGRQQWYTGDTFYLGMGQGYIEATPLQVLRMAAAVANGGDLLRPRVVREIRDSEGNVIEPARPDVVRHIDVSPEHLQTMRLAMRLAVTEGTASKAGIPGVAVAGKTGTAEFGQRLGAGSIYGRYKEHGWMVAFAPYDEPEIAVVVFNEEGSGANTAAPTTARIIEYYFSQRSRLVQAQP